MNQISPAAASAVNVNDSRVGGGLGESCTAITVASSSCSARVVREQRAAVPVRADAEQDRVEGRDGIDRARGHGRGELGGVGVGGGLDVVTEPGVGGRHPVQLRGVDRQRGRTAAAQAGLSLRSSESAGT